MGGHHAHLGGAKRLSWIVNLQVPKAQIGEGLKGLRSLPGDVGEREIGPLGAVGGGDMAVRIELVADMHRHGPAAEAAGESHLRLSTA